MEEEVKKEENKDGKKEQKKVKKEKSSEIVGSIIMISPVKTVFKKLTKISKERNINMSTLCEKIVEDYVANYKKGS
jgi:hypothetical protein